MRKISKSELEEILKQHSLWLKTEGGQRANLSCADLCNVDLSGANLSGANLSGANLSDANLSSADIDYACLPLWCGGLDVHIDDRQATQLLYHLVRNVQYSKNTGVDLKKLVNTAEIINQANKFHREECARLKETEECLND